MSTKKRTSSPRSRAIRRLAHQQLTQLFQPLIECSGKNFAKECSHILHRTILQITQIKDVELYPQMQENIYLLSLLASIFENPILLNLKKQ